MGSVSVGGGSWLVVTKETEVQERVVARAVEVPKVVMFDVYSFCRRMYYCVPGLSGGGIEPAAERGSECEVSVGMAFFEHCLPFGPCKGA
jgi:hypothetical protein